MSNLQNGTVTSERKGPKRMSASEAKSAFGQVAVVTCDACGAESPVGRSFCGDCGKNLNRRMPAPPAPYNAGKSAVSIAKSEATSISEVHPKTKNEFPYERLFATVPGQHPGAIPTPNLKDKNATWKAMQRWDDLHNAWKAAKGIKAPSIAVDMNAAKAKGKAYAEAVALLSLEVLEIIEGNPDATPADICGVLADKSPAYTVHRYVSKKGKETEVPCLVYSGSKLETSGDHNECLDNAIPVSSILSALTNTGEVVRATVGKRTHYSKL